MTQRTYCEACGTYRFKPAGTRCGHCQRAADARAAASVACTGCGEHFARRHMSRLNGASFCPACMEDGTWREAGHPAPSSAGHEVCAPGFTAASFDRAVHRSFCEGLRVAVTDTLGAFLVSNPTHASAYMTTRDACTCNAGTAGTPCKHRARVAFELDICEGRYLPAPAVEAA